MSRREKILYSHRFFIRKSQHYILGNWSEYVPSKEKISYYLRYPKAYIKFMFMCVKEEL